MRDLYDRPGLSLLEVTRLNSIKQRYEGGSQFAEVLIANYDLEERRRAPVQMGLFDEHTGHEI